MLALARQDQIMATRLDVLFSIPGIGMVTALTGLIDRPEIGALNSKQVVSLAGLAPMSQSSGKWQGAHPGWSPKFTAFYLYARSGRNQI